MMATPTPPAAAGQLALSHEVARVCAHTIQKK